MGSLATAPLCAAVGLLLVDPGDKEYVSEHREPLSGGLVGRVFACTTSAGDAAVLKINPPSSDEFAGAPEQEAAALAAWGGRGAVELLAFAADHRALLTRRAVPGTPLPEGDHHEALHAVTGVLSQLFDATIPAVEFAPRAWTRTSSGIM